MSAPLSQAEAVPPKPKTTEVDSQIESYWGGHGFQAQVLCLQFGRDKR